MSHWQRRAVERNLPLVCLTLKRHGHLSEIDRAGREPVELVQVDCLALMVAERSNRPGRGTRFGGIGPRRGLDRAGRRGLAASPASFDVGAGAVRSA